MTDTVFRVEVTDAEAEHLAHLRPAVVASTVGAAIEWYDFLIYSTMTFTPRYRVPRPPSIGPRRTPQHIEI
jgi:hypothetical protein